MTYEALVELFTEGPGAYGQCPSCECGVILMKPLIEKCGWKITCTVCPQLDGIALIEDRVMFLSLEHGVVV